jgi:hypothetical protein
MPDIIPWTEYLIGAMMGRGKMSNGEIYRAVKAECEKAGKELPPSWKDLIRDTLQTGCPKSRGHNGRDDFFVWHGRGYWSCKVTEPQDAQF